MSPFLLQIITSLKGDKMFQKALNGKCRLILILSLSAINFVLAWPAHASDFTHTTTVLSENRTNISATALGNKVFFAGGWTGQVSDVVDVYNIETEEWSVDYLSKARSHIAATTVGNKAIFAGGMLRDLRALNTVDIYDSGTGLWTTSTLSQPRRSLAAAALKEKAFFAGGHDGRRVSSIVDIYDANTGSWSTARLSQARYTLVATTLGNKVIFAGGFLDGFHPNPSDVVDIFDADTDSWSTARLSQPRFNLSALTVGNKAMFAGGVTIGWAESDVVDIYDGDTEEWTTATLLEARHSMGAAVVANKAMFAGGRIDDSHGDERSNLVDIYDADTNSWSTMTLSQGRYRLAAVGYGDVAIFAGGYASGHLDYSNVVDIFKLVKADLPISVDIKPGACPNPLNLNSKGVLSVAILGSEELEVTDIDVSSIRLAGVAPIRSSYEDIATPLADPNECECTTLGPDGYTDLTVKFKIQQIVEGLLDTSDELTTGQELVLSCTAMLSDNQPISGTDCVVLVGKAPR